MINKYLFLTSCIFLLDVYNTILKIKYMINEMQETNCTSEARTHPLDACSNHDANLPHRVGIPAGRIHLTGMQWTGRVCMGGYIKKRIELIKMDFYRR